jgi:hypothetical protein
MGKSVLTLRNLVCEVCGKRQDKTLGMSDIRVNATPGSESHPVGTYLMLRRMASSRMLRRVALVRNDVSEELSASFIGVTRIGELGTTLAATNNRRTLRRNRYFFAGCVAC